ncbi:Tuftelin-interacting protein 11, partial [Orchesella cincta]
MSADLENLVGMYGIGAKLVAKMGFQPGKGLGKNLQGRSVPVRAHFQNGREGIGTGISHLAMRQTTKTLKAHNKVFVRETQWKKISKMGKDYSVECIDLCADDFLPQNFFRDDREAENLANVPVIDLTGPEEKRYDGYEFIPSFQERGESNFGRVSALHNCESVEEFESDQFTSQVLDIVAPLLKRELKSWNVLEDPQKPLDLFKSWADLFGAETTRFKALLWNAWMPSVRQASLHWNVTDTDGMLNLFEAWKPLLPTRIIENIRTQILMPKILEGVQNWDPLSPEEEDNPIHTWIYPWIPHLGSKMEIVYPTIRHKLGKALERLEPSGVSMSPLNWIIQWVDIFPTKQIVGILDTKFFPNWLRFLSTWLNQSPDFEDVENWYLSWRGQFSEKLMGDQRVLQNFQKALGMIVEAIQRSGQQISPIVINRHETPMEVEETQQSFVPLRTMKNDDDLLWEMTSRIPQGFRDLVQLKCEKFGILFHPIPFKHFEGKQVEGGNWKPISLQNLLLVKCYASM